MQDTWCRFPSLSPVYHFLLNEMRSPTRLPLAMPQQSCYSRSKGNHIRKPLGKNLLNDLTPTIFTVAFAPQNARKDRNWFQLEFDIFVAHTLKATKASAPRTAVCGDGIAAVFHFPESTHPSKNLNASLIHNTVHKDFIFPAHSDTLWRQSVLPLKSLLSRKIWSFDIQEITVICKTRLICQG